MIIGIGWVLLMQRVYPKIEERVSGLRIIVLAIAWIGAIPFYSED
jgi:hypothetical protein